MAGLRIILEDNYQRHFLHLPLLILALLISGCLSKAENRYTSEWTSHTCGKRGNGVVVASGPSSQYTNHSGNKAWCFSVQDTKMALKEATAGSAPDKPLIVFVHGRGAHPGKALEKNLIHYLSYENRANVVMFHWPSYQGFAGYAEESAKRAKDDLALFLYEVWDYTRNPANGIIGKKIFLVHSMGNIVLQELAENPATPPHSGILKNKFFDTLILTGPDVDPNGHANWADEIEIAENQYMLIGHTDLVLYGSQHIMNKGLRLGRCVIPPYSANFQYVNFNGTGTNHLYYIDQGPKQSPGYGGKMKNHPGVRDFFAQVLRGKPASPTSVDKLYIDPRYPSGKVWSFRKMYNDPRWIDCG